MVFSGLQSLMKLANKRGNEVGPEVVEEVEGDAVNVVSNTQLKVGACAASFLVLLTSLVTALLISSLASMLSLLCGSQKKHGLSAGGRKIRAVRFPGGEQHRPCHRRIRNHVSPAQDAECAHLVTSSRLWSPPLPILHSQHQPV